MLPKATRECTHAINLPLWNISIWTSLVRTKWRLADSCVSDNIVPIQCTESSIAFANETNIFIRDGGTLTLACICMSVVSVDEIAWKLNDTLIEPDQTVWLTKARNCFTKERENCVIHTTFGLEIKNVSSSHTGYYSCSIPSKEIVPASVYVRIIDRK